MTISQVAVPLRVVASAAVPAAAAPPAPKPVSTAVAAVTTTVASVIPVFLVSGLAVQICRELNLTPTTLGLAVSVYFGVTALGSLPVGALVERLGPAWTARVAILLAADAMLAIALSARSMPALVLMLAVAATANSLGQLASNASLSRSVPRRRHGFAFGAKQAAVPLATLLSGAAVPALALTVGWRWGFVAGAALALAALALVPRDRPRPAMARAPAARRRGREPAGAGLVALSVGAALGAAAATTVATFLVDSAVAQGVTEALAGLMLTLGGVICVCARLFVGWLADRWNRGHLSMVAAMLAIGASGIALLGLRRPAASLLGVTLGYGLGWCWPGLLTFSVARLRPRTPAAVTSITQTGVYAGACLGPLGAGLLVVHGGYTVVWSVSACAMALSACFMLLGSELTVGTNGR